MSQNIHPIIAYKASAAGKCRLGGLVLLFGVSASSFAADRAGPVQEGADTGTMRAGPAESAPRQSGHASPATRPSGPAHEANDATEEDCE